MKVKHLLSIYSGFSPSTWKLVGAGFTNSMGLVIAVYISLYLNSLNFPIKKIGILLSIFGIAGLLGGYLGGFLTDRFSSIKICKISLLLNIFPLALFPLSQSYLYLICVTFLLGLTSSIFRPAYILALAHGETQQNLERVIALRRVAINLGTAFGAALFGFIAIHGYSFVFFTNSIITILAFFLLKNIEAHEKIRSTSKATNTKETTDNTSFFYFVLLLMFLILLVFNQCDAVYPLYLTRDLNFDLKTISWLFTFSGATIALFQMPLTTWLRDINVHIACAVGALLICLGYFILPACNSILLVYLSCGIWTLGEMIFFPALLSLVLKLSGNKKGKRIGIYQLINSLATFSAPAMGSVIYAYEKDLFWYLSGIIGVLVAISFFMTIGILKNNEEETLSTLIKKEA